MNEVLQKALDAVGVKVFANPSGGASIAAIPNGYRLQSLEEFGLSPSYIKQAVKVHRLNDFLAYVERFKNPGTSIIMIAPATKGLGAELACCELDYHSVGAVADAASWCAHSVTYVATKTVEYGLLCGLDCKLMAQDEFAHAIEPLLRFVKDMKAAELLEVLRTINLTSKGKFQSINDDFSGSVDFTYELQVSASAGTQERKLKVPREISFYMPLIEGNAAWPVNTKLMYRIPPEPGGKVQLGLRMPDRRLDEERLVESLATNIANQSGLLTMVGTL